MGDVGAHQEWWLRGFRGGAELASHGGHSTRRLLLFARLSSGRTSCAEPAVALGTPPCGSAPKQGRWPSRSSVWRLVASVGVC